MAPTKFNPLSLQIVCGLPLLETNLSMPARNASVVRSEMTSRWMALVEKHMNTHTCAVMMTGFRVCPCFREKGPAKSIPVV